MFGTEEMPTAPWPRNPGAWTPAERMDVTDPTMLAQRRNRVRRIDYQPCRLYWGELQPIRIFRPATAEERRQEAKAFKKHYRHLLRQERTAPAAAPAKPVKPKFVS